MSEKISHHEADSSIPDPEEEKKKLVLFFVEKTREAMLREWGIDNLSNIEAVKLRQIMEKVMDEQKKMEELFREGKITENALFASNLDEVIARWLYELYGIREKEVHRLERIINMTTSEVFEYDAPDTEEAALKEREINDKGHVFAIYRLVPDDFREYLKRVRERAHNL